MNRKLNIYYVNRIKTEFELTRRILSNGNEIMAKHIIGRIYEIEIIY